MAAPHTIESNEEKLQLRLQALQNTKKTTNLHSEETKLWLKPHIALLGIQSSLLETCIEILEYMGDVKVVWLHLQECTGCSESLLRTETPSFDVMILDIFSIAYHDLVMAGSGHNANAVLARVSANEKYVLLVEGSVPMDFAKEYITIGGKSGYDEVSHLIEHAEAVFAVGTCSSYGGIQTAYPNPTNGHALSELFSKPIVNIPGCPPSDKNITATLLSYYLFGELPKRDDLGRPLWAYSKSVHDLCERKSFFLSGDFVESFDDPNMKEGYCLYKVGCKGPYTYNNCPKVKFNAKTSWPVQGGHGCIGCSEPNFWDNFGNIEKPLSNASFFAFNDTFLPKVSILQTIKKEKFIESIDEYKEFVRTLESKKSVFMSLDSQNEVFVYENGDCIEILKQSFSLNPKLLLQSYESKNKQGKKLYANYQKAFAKRHDSLMQLCEKEKTSNSIYDVMSLFMMVLDDESTLHKNESESVEKWLQENGTQGDLAQRFQAKEVLNLARACLFPHRSEFGFKLKKEGEHYALDFTKALSLAMSYRIGGLDIYGLAYSLVCGIVEALFEMVPEESDMVVLQGEIFSLPSTQKIAQKALQGKKIVLVAPNNKACKS